MKKMFIILLLTVSASAYAEEICGKVTTLDIVTFEPNNLGDSFSNYADATLLRKDGTSVVIRLRGGDPVSVAIASKVNGLEMCAHYTGRYSESSEKKNGFVTLK